MDLPTALFCLLAMLHRLHPVLEHRTTLDGSVLEWEGWPSELGMENLNYLLTRHTWEVLNSTQAWLHPWIWFIRLENQAEYFFQSFEGWKQLFRFRTKLYPFATPGVALELGSWLEKQALRPPPQTSWIRVHKLTKPQAVWADSAAWEALLFLAVSESPGELGKRKTQSPASWTCLLKSG